MYFTVRNGIIHMSTGNDLPLPIPGHCSRGDVCMMCRFLLHWTRTMLSTDFQLPSSSHYNPLTQSLNSLLYYLTAASPDAAVHRARKKSMRLQLWKYAYWSPQLQPEAHYHRPYSLWCPSLLSRKMDHLTFSPILIPSTKY